MQIVDANALWIRSTILTLRRRETPMTFEVYPMQHVGSPEFYERVRRRVNRCDLVVAEGVGDSRAGRLLTMSYGIARFWRSSGLIVQNLYPYSFDIPVVCPDMTGAQFDRGWSALPWWQRAVMTCVVPPYALAMLVMGPRRFILDNMQGVDEFEVAKLDDTNMPELVYLILDQRDQLLLDALFDLHRRRCHEDIRIAVVYGAAHVPAIVNGLAARYGYIARYGDFMTIVDL